MADLAQIVITAKDATGPGIASAQSGLKSLSASAAALAGSFTALGGMLAVGMFADIFRDAVSAASALDDLSDSTGSSVESLSKLRNVVQVSGGSFESLQLMLLKVGKGIAGIDDEGGKAAKALAALGIAAKDPAQALQEVANKLDQFADGPGKIALAMDLLGKEGAKLLPLLKDMAQANDIGSTYTAKQAKEAEDLEKAWRRLGVESASLKQAMLNTIVPALTDIITAFNLARKAGLGFWAAVTMADSATSNDPTQMLLAEKKRLAELTAEYEKYSGWAARPFFSASEADVEKSRQRVAALQAIVNRANQASLDADPSSDLAARAGMKPQLPYTGGDTKVAKQAVSDYADEIVRLQHEFDKLSDPGGSYDKLAAAVAKYVADLRAGKKVNGEQAMQMFQDAIAVDELAQSLKEEADAEREAEQAVKEYTDELIRRDEAFSKLVQQEQASVDAIRSTTEGYLKQADALTKTEDELLALEQTRLQGIVTDKLATTGVDDTTAALEDQIKAIQKLRDTKAGVALKEQADKTAKAWQDAARNIGDDLSDAFLRAAESGGNFFKSLANDLKRMFSNLVLRPIIQGVMAPLAGGLTSMLYGGSASGHASGATGGSWMSYGPTGLGAYNQLGGTGSFNLLGNANTIGGLANGVISYGGTQYVWSNGTWAPILEGSGGELFMGSAGQSLGGMAGTGLTYMGAGLTGYAIGTGLHSLIGNDRNQFGMQSGATAGAMIGTYFMPVIGTIIGAIIGALAGSLLKSGGGPKVGGYGYAGMIDPWNRDQHFTPNSGDALMTSTAQAFVQNFDKLVASYGGTKGKFGFDIGFDSDPKGTTDDRLGVRAFMNGKQVYDYWSGDSWLGDASKGETKLQEEIAKQLVKATLAGLQASDMDVRIRDVFNRIAADAVTQEQLDNLIAFGNAMKAIIDVVDGDIIKSANDAWEKANRSSVQILADMADNLITLSADFDGSTESMQALAAATLEYNNAAINTLNGIKRISLQLNEMFGSTRQSLEMFGLSPEQLYDRYRQDADVAFQMLLGATDPETVKALSEKINADIQAAFGALPDELKTAQQNPLIAYLDSVNAAAQAKLATLSADISSSTESPFAAVGDVLDGAAAKFMGAATDSTSAADKMSNAADLFIAAVESFAAQLPIRVVATYASVEANG